MALFDEKVAQQLREILDKMADPVELVFFTQEIDCDSCSDARQFVEEFSALSDKLSLTAHDFQRDEKQVSRYHIMRVPAIVISRKDIDTGIRFYGIPGGYEINSFVGSIMEVSGRGQNIPEDVLERIRKIDTDVHFQVFVSLSCPHCPGAVAAAHKLALENPKIQADMIDTNLFPPLSEKYEIRGVPKTIVNEKTEIMGAQPLQAFIEAAEKA